MTISVPEFTGVRALPRAFESGLIEGVVRRADKRGRELGLPTPNLRIDIGVVKDGLWAATVELPDGRLIPATVSRGRRATFYGRDGVRLLTIHILGVSEDVYGVHVRPWISRKIRLQKRRSNVDDPIVQMQEDVNDPRRWAGATPRLVTRRSSWRGGRKGA